jgi:hypothetical protein
MVTLMDLRNATLSARERTNDRTIGTQVKAGKVQVVRVTYPPGKGGRSVVTPITPFLTPEDAIRALDAL